LEKEPWGYSTRIKITDCDKDLLTDIEYCKKYLTDVVRHIDMTPFGDPIVVHFGKDPKVSGLSGFQLLEESNIAFHFTDGGETGMTFDAYIDVFSCKLYDSDEVVNYSETYFGGKVEYSRFEER